MLLTSAPFCMNGNERSRSVQVAQPCTLNQHVLGFRPKSKPCCIYGWTRYVIPQILSSRHHRLDTRVRHGRRLHKLNSTPSSFVPLASSRNPMPSYWPTPSHRCNRHVQLRNVGRQRWTRSDHSLWSDFYSLLTASSRKTCNPLKRLATPLKELSYRLLVELIVY
jgi:hypothetical protein